MVILAIIGAILLGWFIVAFSAMVVAWPLSLAWNYVVPEVFGLPSIGYWQAFCLFLVFGLLVKSSSSSNSSSRD